MQSKRTRPWLQNTWYVAALSQEVGPEALFARTLLDTPVLIYRREENGEPVALHDRCPHRFAPLHRGWREGDDVVCMYHALRFDCTGTCNHNPHGKGKIPVLAQVRSFPLVERDGFIWIWMGDEPADMSALPDYGELVSGHPNSVGYTYMPVGANYQLITDNVMDLSHIDHVHGEIITTRGQLTPLIPQVALGERSVNARWEWSQQPAMMIFANFLPAPSEPARHFFDITWTPPGHIQLSVGATQEPRNALDLDHTIGQYDLHTVTPESIDRTHYFFATRRNHLEEDAEYNAQKIAGMHGAFQDEDVPLIESVQERMGTDDFFGLEPVLMSNDAAAAKVRRKLLEMLREEDQRLG
ncbi:aromatic ring-hydroxylating dioxygenase subunit alpha [Pseudenhygromyxa sp. WMMC2535]|nr:aromatic ring-hydroxylating dioxygenase subunit alpha [Pseudenhygromyxa sp. WMMC2535]